MKKFSCCLLISGLVVGSFLGAGCKAKLGGAYKAKVTWAQPPGPPAIVNAYNRIFDNFRKTHPEIDLNVIYVQQDYEQKVLAIIAGNQPLDAIFLYPENLMPMISKGALMPLDDFLAKDITVDEKARITLATAFSGLVKQSGNSAGESAAGSSQQVRW